MPGYDSWKTRTPDDGQWDPTLDEQEMSDDWHKQYEEASEEYALAEEAYKIAESAMTRAIFRRNEAERTLSRLYREHIVPCNNS